MFEPLPSLAVTVEHETNGSYWWLILETKQMPDDGCLLVEAAAGFSSYRAALQAGCAALIAIVGDRDRGSLGGDSKHLEFKSTGTLH